MIVQVRFEATPRRRRLLHGTGDASVDLVRSRKDDCTMLPLLQLTTREGWCLQVELSVGDVLGLGRDIVELLSADQEQVARWWAKLATGDDGRPAAAVS